MRLEQGQPAPAFSGVDHDDNEITSADFAGRSFVVYFYPKAFTPGCTTESCDFRDRHEFFEKAGYAIVGVSPDKPEKLARFRDEYDLPFPLISDPDHEIAEAFGAWGIKKNYGREYEGLIRSTIVIGEDGMVTAAWYNVRAKGHAERVAGSVVNG
ncbi:MAG: thioredoxin-dependent thiol peroxidase [Actinomycetota bacterium]